MDLQDGVVVVREKTLILDWELIDELPRILQEVVPQLVAPGHVAESSLEQLRPPPEATLAA